MSAKLDALKRRFIVDQAPSASARRRVHVPPSPRPTAPKRGRQILQWIIEEADEQLQLGERSPRVRVSKTDIKLMRSLLQWIEGMERQES